MADAWLLSAVKAKPKKLTLSAKALTSIPSIVGQISCLEVLVLKSNKLTDLPEELALLTRLNTINLGCNLFESLPTVFEHVKCLKKLHLFQNKLTGIDAAALCGLKGLTLLNLNDNSISSLPPDIECLQKLKYLSISNNRLSEIPTALCKLKNLEELHLSRNFIASLPKNFGSLKNLRKFYCQKNKLQHLPESLCRCVHLKVLDLSANSINIFPSQLLQLHLTELYCEQNNLLQHSPVHSIQDAEVFSLKELCARCVVRASKDSNSAMREDVMNYPAAEELCSKASSCVVCGGPYVDTWLECVQFVDSRKVLRTKTNAGLIPVRGRLCSYTCFNATTHNYYGIAQARKI